MNNKILLFSSIILLFSIEVCFSQTNLNQKYTRNMSNKLSFTTSYNQFYIIDKGSNMNIDDSFWTVESYSERLASNNGILGVLIGSYGKVSGEIIFLSKQENKIDFKTYDHIVEASLKIKSGTLQIIDCPNSSIEFEVNVPPGDYRVRIYSQNLASIEGDEGNDFYRIEVWKVDFFEKKVLKNWEG